jgi:hypothetical protein
MGWHTVHAATPHPLGAPFGYCIRCAYVVVKFQDKWWHLSRKSQTRTNVDGDAR